MAPATDRRSRSEELLASLAPAGIRLGLGPMLGILRSLDCRQPQMPVVHVAGTNGKGSTALLFASLAGGTGARVGLYTSPHLEEPRERLRIDGRAIDEPRFEKLMERVLKASSEELSYFEALTASAILWFVEERVDLMVLEVGLGGRLDATNAVDGDLALITSIDRDHTDWLGETVEEIVAEKVGILRAGRPAISARRQSDRAMEGLVEATRRRGVEIRVAEALPKGLMAPLLGEHQGLNAGLALSASRVLPSLGIRQPSLDEIRWAWERCSWPGRLEAVRLPNGAEVLLDGAHNPAGARVLAKTLVGLPYALLFGVLEDKEIGPMAQTLAAEAESLWLTEPPSPRAQSVTSLLDLDLPRVNGFHADPNVALQRALARCLASQVSPRLVVAGSLVLVGFARQWLNEHFGVPSLAAETLLWQRRVRPLS